MAHKSESLNLLLELLRGDLGEPYRTLLQGGRLWSWDPQGLFKPQLGLVSEVVLPKQLKLLQPGDCLITSSDTVELEGVRLANWSHQPQASAEAWQKLIQDLPEDFYAQLAFERPPVERGIFLDRDGVVLEAVSYLGDPSQVRLRSGVCDFLKAARKKGFKIFLITNQSGLGRGKFSWSDFDQVQQQMQHLLLEQSLWFDDIEVAPFFVTSKEPEFLLWPEKRKPGTQMLHRLSRKHGVDLSKSVLIGDRRSDLEAGAALGVQKLVLLESAETASDSFEDLQFQFSRVNDFSDLTL
jgi:D-glycero-D-manno-heptose 1,7-bisphosphate phosphatase